MEKDKVHKIEEMWAWVCVEPDGNERIPAQCVDLEGVNTFLPFVGADSDRVKSLRKFVHQIAQIKGLPIKLMRFHGAEIVEAYTVGDLDAILKEPDHDQ